VVETDIADCFSAIPHDELMQAIEERVCDQTMLKLLRAMVAIQDPRALSDLAWLGCLLACRLDRRAGSMIMAGCPGRGRRLMRS
jgi:hypothetical protein